jgi:hypothetical protein
VAWEGGLDWTGLLAAEDLTIIRSKRARQEKSPFELFDPSTSIRTARTSGSRVSDGDGSKGVIDDDSVNNKKSSKQGVDQNTNRSININYSNGRL